MTLLECSHLCHSNYSTSSNSSESQQPPLRLSRKDGSLEEEKQEEEGGGEEEKEEEEGGGEEEKEEEEGGGEEEEEEGEGRGGSGLNSSSSSSSSTASCCCCSSVVPISDVYLPPEREKKGEKRTVDVDSSVLSLAWPLQDTCQQPSTTLNSEAGICSTDAACTSTKKSALQQQAAAASSAEATKETMLSTSSSALPRIGKKVDNNKSQSAAAKEAATKEVVEKEAAEDTASWTSQLCFCCGSMRCLKSAPSAIERNSSVGGGRPCLKKQGLSKALRSSSVVVSLGVSTNSPTVLHISRTEEEEKDEIEEEEEEKGELVYFAPPLSSAAPSRTTNTASFAVDSNTGTTAETVSGGPNTTHTGTASGGLTNIWEKQQQQQQQQEQQQQQQIVEDEGLSAAAAGVFGDCVNSGLAISSGCGEVSDGDGVGGSGGGGGLVVGLAEDDQQQLRLSSNSSVDAFQWNVRGRNSFLLILDSLRNSEPLDEVSACGGGADGGDGGGGATAVGVGARATQHCSGGEKVLSFGMAPTAAESTKAGLQAWKALRRGSRLLHMLTCFGEDAENDEVGSIARSQQTVAMVFDGLLTFENTFLSRLLEYKRLSQTLPPPPPTVDGKVLQLFLIHLSHEGTDDATSSDAAFLSRVGRLLNEVADALDSCSLHLVTVVLLAGSMPQLHHQQPPFAHFFCESPYLSFEGQQQSRRRCSLCIPNKEETSTAFPHLFCASHYCATCMQQQPHFCHACSTAAVAAAPQQPAVVRGPLLCNPSSTTAATLPRKPCRFTSTPQQLLTCTRAIEKALPKKSLANDEAAACVSGSTASSCCLADSSSPTSPEKKPFPAPTPSPPPSPHSSCPDCMRFLHAGGVPSDDCMRFLHAGGVPSDDCMRFLHAGGVPPRYCCPHDCMHHQSSQQQDSKNEAVSLKGLKRQEICGAWSRSRSNRCTAAGTAIGSEKASDLEEPVHVHAVSQRGVQQRSEKLSQSNSMLFEAATTGERGGDSGCAEEETQVKKVKPKKARNTGCCFGCSGQYIGGAAEELHLFGEGVVDDSGETAATTAAATTIERSTGGGGCGCGGFVGCDLMGASSVVMSSKGANSLFSSATSSQSVVEDVSQLSELRSSIKNSGPENLVATTNCCCGGEACKESTRETTVRHSRCFLTPACISLTCTACAAADSSLCRILRASSQSPPNYEILTGLETPRYFYFRSLMRLPIPTTCVATTPPSAVIKPPPLPPPTANPHNFYSSSSSSSLTLSSSSGTDDIKDLKTGHVLQLQNTLNLSDDDKADSEKAAVWVVPIGNSSSRKSSREKERKKPVVMDIPTNTKSRNTMKTPFSMCTNTPATAGKKVVSMISDSDHSAAVKQKKSSLWDGVETQQKVVQLSSFQAENSCPPPSPSSLVVVQKCPAATAGDVFGVNSHRQQHSAFPSDFRCFSNGDEKKDKEVVVVDGDQKKRSKNCGCGVVVIKNSRVCCKNNDERLMSGFFLKGFEEQELIRHVPPGQFGLLEFPRFLAHFRVQFIPTSVPHVHLYKAQPRTILTSPLESESAVGGAAATLKKSKNSSEGVVVHPASSSSLKRGSSSFLHASFPTSSQPPPTTTTITQKSPTRTTTTRRSSSSSSTCRQSSNSQSPKNSRNPSSSSSCRGCDDEGERHNTPPPTGSNSSRKCNRRSIDDIHADLLSISQSSSGNNGGLKPLQQQPNSYSERVVVGLVDQTTSSGFLGEGRSSSRPPTCSRPYTHNSSSSTTNNNRKSSKSGPNGAAGVGDSDETTSNKNSSSNNRRGRRSRFFVRVLLTVNVEQQHRQQFVFLKGFANTTQGPPGVRRGEGGVDTDQGERTLQNSSNRNTSPCGGSPFLLRSFDTLFFDQERYFVDGLNALEAAIGKAPDNDTMAGNHLLITVLVLFASPSKKKATPPNAHLATSRAVRADALEVHMHAPTHHHPSRNCSIENSSHHFEACSAAEAAAQAARALGTGAAKAATATTKGFAAVAAGPSSISSGSFIRTTKTTATTMLDEPAASSIISERGIKGFFTASPQTPATAASYPGQRLSVAILETAARKLMTQYERRLAKLNVKKVELRYLQRHLSSAAGEGQSVPIRIVVDNPTGQALRLRKFLEVRNPTSGEVVFSAVDSRGFLSSSSSNNLFNNSNGFHATAPAEFASTSTSFKHASIKLCDDSDFDGRPVLVPHPLPSALDLRRAQAFNVSTVFIYDFLDLFEEAIRKQWRNSPKYFLPAPDEHQTWNRGFGTSDFGRSSATTTGERNPTANSFLPERVFRATELRLNRRGELEEVHREAGLNECGMVAWRVTMYTPEFPKGRHVILIGNDVTFQMGTFGVTEDLLFQKASEIARLEGIPRIYIAVNSGARMGLANEVIKVFRVEWIDKAHPARGFKYLYVTEKDFKQLKKSDSIVAELVQHPTEGKVYKITTIVGAQIGLGVENLCGSGAIAGETAKAYKSTFTITFCSGRSVGIGAYITRLGQRVIQKAVNAPLLLTGYQALNRLIGRDVYSSNDEIGGIDVMYKNGITHLIVKDDIEGCEAILDWLSFVPERREGPLPIMVDPTDPVTRPVAYKPARATEDPRLMFTGCTDPQGNWLGGVFDRNSFREVMADWARSVITGRARLGGIPVGVVAVETRVTEAKQPADPAMPHSSEVLLTRAGQVWFPDSAYKTAQAIWDFNQEELPLFIFANWRGFSGGQRDMFNEVLKFGAYIVDALVAYSQPCFVYLPPKGELRGGSWVVVDSRLNSEHMEMYADSESRGGVMEPSGTVEIKFRTKMLVETMKRLDSSIIRLEQEDAQLASDGLPIDAPRRQAIKDEKERRIADLLPVYKQVAIHFADMHDTAVRMKKRDAVQDVVVWEQSRHFFYWRLRRQLILFNLRKEIVAASPSFSLVQAENLVLKWAAEAGHNVEGNYQFVQWACHSIAFFGAKLMNLRLNYKRREFEEFAAEHPSAFLEVIRKMDFPLYERLELLSSLSEQSKKSSSTQRSRAALSLITKPHNTPI